MIPSAQMLDLCLLDLPPGDIAEFGVLRGDTTIRLAECATALNRKLWAVDSFEGMGEPTEWDANPDGTQQYPKGRFKVITPEDLWNRLDPVSSGIHYECIKGFVPECLSKLGEVQLAFAYADLDHYQPTAELLEWLHNHIVPGGVILCDDWFPGKCRLASRAIHAFIGSHDYDVVFQEYRQIALRKPL